MEKSKKIKTRKPIGNSGYWVDTIELQNALKGIDLGYYSWIMTKQQSEIYLAKDTIKIITDIWKRYMEKKIKAIQITEGSLAYNYYKISGLDLIKLKNLIKKGFFKHYSWILKENDYVLLSKETITSMNEQWKNRKK